MCGELGDTVLVSAANKLRGTGRPPCDSRSSSFSLCAVELGPAAALPACVSELLGDSTKPVAEAKPSRLLGRWISSVASGSG